MQCPLKHWLSVQGMPSSQSESPQHSAQSPSQHFSVPVHFEGASQ
jgi:hypothetical protein